MKLTVAGAGVFGLAVAWEGLRRGMAVTVIDPGGPGAGASGGVVGALSPHPPAPWSDRKATQVAALRAAPGWWTEVAAAGGLDPAHAAIGRAIPLRDAGARARAEAQVAAARAHWGGAAWRILDADALPGWLAPEAAPFGLARETLSARIFPRAAVAALAAAIRAQGGEIRQGRIALADAPRPLVLATGAASLLPALPCGGVKGQAALLAAEAPPGAPMLYDDGLYVVPQPGGLVAVGSTSEADWTDPTAVDERLEAVIARARALSPALAGAPIVEGWAGLRPRAALPDPMVGAVPGLPGVFVATGGFRTGLATAPAVGAATAALVLGADPGLPETWSVPAHLEAMRRKAARPG